MNKRIFYFALILSSISMVSGLTLYLLYFNGDFSIDSTQWSNFSTYYSLFINTASLIILGMIGYLTYDTTDKYNKLQNQPLLYIGVDDPLLYTNLYKNSWCVFNASKAPALNLYVRYYYYKDRDGIPSQWITSSSLTGDGKKELFWIHWADKIEIAYSDLTEENYYILSVQDTNDRKVVPIKKDDFRAIASQSNKYYNIITIRDKFDVYVTNQRLANKSNDEILRKDNYYQFISPLLFPESK